ELRGALPHAPMFVSMRLFTPSLVLLLGMVLWLIYELRRGRTLLQAQEGLIELESRRQELNHRYGAALEPLATLESRLQTVSLYDTSTGLGNRSSLLRRIEVALDSMRQTREGILSVLAIGFDRFHQITNSFGAEYAARVLVVAAERVQSALPA